MTSTPYTTFTHAFNVMGCPCNLHVCCEDAEHFERVKADVLKELTRLDKYYTNYSDDSFTADINRTAGTGAKFKVDEETAALLDYSEECYRLSGGLFDITAGTLRKAWDYQAKNPRLPTPDEIAPLMKAVGWEKVKWERPWITLPPEGMILDFGGVVKEYAADAAAGVCYKHDVHHGFIDLGGDIRLLGPQPDGKPWVMGVKNPLDPAKDIAVVYLSTGALVTSGNYERFIEIDGKRYSHILNPKTGWPVDGFPSITIMGDYCLVAGSAATIASLLPQEEALSWLKDLGLPYICVDQEGKLYRNC